MSAPVEDNPTCLASRNDQWAVVGVCIACIGLLMPVLGVWEPWEAENAFIVERMLETGEWFQVSVDGRKFLSELPYAWWPTTLISALVGLSEISLRLPGLLFSVVTALLLFQVTHRFFDRMSAWFAFLALMAMPLFTYHTRLSMGLAPMMCAASISSLCFMRVLDDAPVGRGWIWCAWLSAAFAGLAGGLTGILTPLAVLVAMILAQPNSTAKLGALRRLVQPDSLSACLALLALGWWQALENRPDGSSVSALLVLSESIDGVFKSSDRPSFELFVHQLGFGLFPLIALVPFALADLLTDDDESTSNSRCSILLIATTTWFAASFFVPAIGSAFSHYGFFIGAPAVALLLGVYIAKLIRGGPQPIFAIGTVLVLALLDSNLKHDTRALADTLVGGNIDSFPAQMPWWRVSRLLSMCLLGVLLVYQGGLHRWVAKMTGLFAYPQSPRPMFDKVIGLVSLVVPLGLWSKAAYLAPLVALPYWGNLKLSGRRIILGLVAYALTHICLRLVWNTRVRVLKGRQEGRLSDYSRALADFFDGIEVRESLKRVSSSLFYPRLSPRLFEPALFAWSAILPASIVLKPTGSWMLRQLTPVLELPLWGTMARNHRVICMALAAWLVAYAVFYFTLKLRHRTLSGRPEGRISRLFDALGIRLESWGVAPTAMVSVLSLWVVFLNLPIASALTTNFSQKELLSRFEELSGGSASIYKYRIGKGKSSFYARDLPTLQRPDFKEKVKEEDRFFAIIPRKELSAVNDEFRKATERTIPVLDDRGSRFMLVSNQLLDGEDDRNPINRALVNELPPSAKKVAIVFEDKIELVGWSLSPSTPRPGSPVTMHLYWKALKSNLGSWKVFVHIDAPGQRIHGDHDPVAGIFPTRNWKAGDLIHDEHKITVKRTISPASFTFYAGLYRGSTRLKIKSGPKDKDNRAKLGTIQVR